MRFSPGDTVKIKPSREFTGKVIALHGKRYEVGITNLEGYPNAWSFFDEWELELVKRASPEWDQETI